MKLVEVLRDTASHLHEVRERMTPEGFEEHMRGLLLWVAQDIEAIAVHADHPHPSNSP